MSEELKPCPFCGGEAELLETKDFKGQTFSACIMCRECECITCHFASKSTAIEAWNRRSEE